MEEYNTPIFAQAKIEYTKQLIDLFYIRMYEGIRSIYDETKNIHNKQKTNLHIIYIFRELLEKIPIWNQEIIQKETDRIIQVSKCDWIDDLITAVFISHTKILTSIGPNNSFNKINITIPKTTTFIHKIYINIAREIWKNPYLFNEDVLGHEYQRNTKEIETIIKECIEGTIRDLLPIKEILREHLETYDTNDNSMNNMKEIKKMLREELETITKQVKNTNDTEETNNTEEINNTEETNNTKEINNTEEDITVETSDTKENMNDNQSYDQLDASKQEYDFNKEINELFDINDNTNDNINDNINDDPSEETIQEQCKDITVNDITVPVDEEQYDNVDIINHTDATISNDKVERLLNTMKEETVYPEPIKSEPIKSEPIKNTDPNITMNLFNDLDETVKPEIEDTSMNPINNQSMDTSSQKQEETQEVKQDETKKDKLELNQDETKKDKLELNQDETKKAIKIEMPSETKNKKSLYPNLQKKNNSTPEINITKIDEEKEMKEFPEPVVNKEVVSFEKSDNDDTQTLDNFFSDIKDIMNKKDIPIQDNDNKMILFSDADDF